MNSFVVIVFAAVVALASAGGLIGGAYTAGYAAAPLAYSAGYAGYAAPVVARSYGAYAAPAYGAYGYAAPAAYGAYGAYGYGAGLYGRSAYGFL